MSTNLPDTPLPAAPPADAPLFQRTDQSALYPYTRREYARRLAWELVRATLFRWSPRRAYGWRLWLLRVFGARIGPNAGVRPTTRVFYPWLLTLGQRSILGDGVDVYNLGPVEIGEHTVVSQGTYICGGTHDYTRPDLPLVRAGVRIGRGVWIAAQAFIGPGVCIGDNSVIGARAVVVGDIPPGVVAAGNPARVIKPRIP